MQRGIKNIAVFLGRFWKENEIVFLELYVTEAISSCMYYVLQSTNAQICKPVDF